MVLYKREGNLVKAYSDAGLKIRGGSPEGIYSVAYDPVDCGREYIETGEPVDTMDRNPSAPRVFSKLKLEAALFEASVLDRVDAFIDSQTVTNEFGQTMPLRRRYNTALEFSEDHPDFVKVFKALKQLLGVSDAKAEEILAASVKDS